MDIYKEIINKKADDRELVTVGRIVVFISLIISMLIAPSFGNLGQVFQAIQEYTGVVSPGILAVFMMGLFYRKATNNGAIWGILISIPIAMYFKVVAKGWIDIFPNFMKGIFIGEIPFLHQMGITFLITLLVIFIISYLEGNRNDPKGIILSKKLFHTSSSFNIPAFIVLIITAMLYAIFW
jgi:SSS family solute:Na+ symporter